MDLYPTSDQEQIIEAAASYMKGELPADRLPTAGDAGVGVGAWRSLAAMGWFAMGVAEDKGGLGLSVVEEALVLREVGRQAGPLSVLATALAASAAAALGDTVLVADLASGARRAAFGLVDARDGGYRLLDVVHADLVLAWDTSGIGLADLTAFPGRRPVRCIDLSLQALSADAPAAGDIRWAPADLVRRARLLAAAFLVGGAEATRDLSTEYAKVRVQYGKPIGAFQAISHACARMALGCEEAVSMLQFAAVCVRDEKEQPDFQAAAARVVAARVAYDNATAAMQLFGGYGQTYDYLPHFYLKQAILIGMLGGGADEDLAAVISVASTLGD